MTAVFEMLLFGMMQLRFKTAPCVGWALRRVPRAGMASMVHRGPLGADVVGVKIMGEGVLACLGASMLTFGLSCPGPLYV